MRPRQWVEGSWLPGHDVQFYESERFLVDAVAEFLTTGVRTGQPIVVIATTAHQRDFMDRMRQLGVDFEELVLDYDVTFLDARETLDAFMEGGRPNPELFNATVGSVFEKVMRKRPYIIVRAYGEMVDLLWSDGKATAAVELEELWNRLARKYAFSLLCAYSATTLECDSGGQTIADICATHKRILTAESAPLAARLGIVPT